MEFIHVLVEQRTTTGARLHDNNVTDMRRLTIFDLPGELRNNIYGCILADDQPVVVLYGEPTASASPYSTWRTDPPSPAPIPSKITQLLNMSWANRELRKEVRSYFFANNKIEVTGISGATFTTFLDKISADGRANAVVLNLSGTNFWMYYNLYRIIAELVRLREFNITMDVGHLLSFEGSMNIHSYVHSWQPRIEEHPALVASFNIGIFALLPTLKSLEIKCAIPDWSCRFQHGVSQGQRR